MRRILSIAWFSSALCTAFGQGSINFLAGSSPAFHLSTNSVGGGPVTGETGPPSAGYRYYYALFVADSTITSVGSRTPTGALDPTLAPGWLPAIWAIGNPAGASGIAYATNFSSGRFTGNPTTDDVLVAGHANGSSASFVVVGWSSQVAGMDWAAAQAWIDFAIQFGEGPSVGWTGASDVATSIQLGGGINPAQNLFGFVPGQIQNAMILQLQVPEPGIFALLSLGGALLIFRRPTMQYQKANGSMIG